MVVGVGIAKWVRNLRTHNGSADTIAIQEQVAEAVARADAVIAAVKDLFDHIAANESMGKPYG